MAYPYDEATGNISFDQGKVFFTCPVEGGVPDGHCQDEHGFIWVACHGTARVYRLDHSGNIVAEIELPTRCVTCPAFCGTELIITSAAEQEPEKYPWSKKYGGAVFKIDGEWFLEDTFIPAVCEKSTDSFNLCSRRPWQAIEQVQDDQQGMIEGMDTPTRPYRCSID